MGFVRATLWVTVASLSFAGARAAEVSGEGLAAALSLPEAAEQLPALKEAIGSRLDRLQGPPYSRTELLPLAYLYHANGYDDRARALYDWLIGASEEAVDRGRLNYLAADVVKEKGDAVSTEAYLEAAVQAFEGYPLAWALLGEAKFKSSDLPAAESHFRKALALSEDVSMARLGLARVHERRGEFEKAARQLEGLLASDPNNYNAQALLSRAYGRLGDERRAFQMSQSITRSSQPPRDDPWLEPVRAAILDPQRLDFLFLDYFMIGEYERALPYLERMEAVDPTNPRNDRYRGVYHKERGELFLAVRSLRAGIERGGEPGEFYLQLVKTLKLRERLEDAEAAAREGWEASDGDVEIGLEWARLLFERHQWGEAMALLETVLAKDPYEIEAHLLYARVASLSGAQAKAESSFSMLLQLAPLDPEVLLRAALVKMESGRYEEALPIVEQALGASPYYEDAIVLRADAYFELGQQARAAGEAESALDRFERALGIWPQHLEALSGRAQVLLELERFELAEAALSELIDLMEAPPPNLLMVYGDTLRANGDAARARAVWQEALRVAGNLQELSNLRRMLRARLASP